MDKHLLEIAQAESLRLLNEDLIQNKKKPVSSDIDITEIIIKYIEQSQKKNK